MFLFCLVLFCFFNLFFFRFLFAFCFVLFCFVLLFFCCCCFFDPQYNHLITRSILEAEKLFSLYRALYQTPSKFPAFHKIYRYYFVGASILICEYCTILVPTILIQARFFFLLDSCSTMKRHYICTNTCHLTKHESHKSFCEKNSGAVM